MGIGWLYGGYPSRLEKQEERGKLGTGHQWQL